MPSQERTKSTYALQWGRYRIVRPEEDRATFVARTGFDLGGLGGATVLDAGCGMGRYARIAAGAGARVVGMDLSEAVHAARDVTTGAGNLGFVRGDLFRPPFGPGTFDAIYSLGVLDHTPDPRRAFLALAALLKPGGRIAVWVYPRENPAVERIMDAHRAVSTRLPLGLLVALSRLTAPIGGLKRRLFFHRNRLMQRAGVALHALTIGVSMHPDPEVRVCDTIDWYAPRFASRHTLAEVRGWFGEGGLIEVEDLSANSARFHQGQGNGVNLSGRRPG